MILAVCARFLAMCVHVGGIFRAFSCGSPTWALGIVIDALVTYKMCNIRNKSYGSNQGGTCGGTTQGGVSF